MHRLTCSCFLPFLLGKLFLLAFLFPLGICLCSLWSPPFPLHAIALVPLSLAKVALSSPCSRSGLPLTRQGAALAHLDSLPPYDLILWTDSSVSFPFGKGSSGVLANCTFCGTEATLSFSAGPVCSSFSAEACAILHTLCWSWQHQQVCHFSSLLLLSDSCSVLTSLLSPPFFLSSQTLWQIWQELSSLSFCSIRLQWIPRRLFLQGNNMAEELARWGVLLQSHVVSLLLSLVSTLVFSWTGGILSHQSILTHRFPRFLLRNLCSLVMLTVSSLVFAATNTAFC